MRIGQYLVVLLVCLLCESSLSLFSIQGRATAQDVLEPKLQILNGTDRALDVFWIQSDTQRVFNRTLEPGQQSSITTTLGHRFALADRDGGFEDEVTSQVPVQAFRAGGVPGFYTQRLEAHGFPIVASDRVNPYALKEAAYLVDLMLAERPDVRKAMIQSGSRLCILAWNEFTTQQPEWEWLALRPAAGFPGIAPNDYYDARARGMGGSQTDPFCSCGEENLLCYPGDPYSTENILIHELAHNIHLRGMVNVDPTFDSRVKAAYDAAMQEGLWKGKYASVNHHEYFAEGVQSWFDDNRQDDHDHNHVNTREELVEYDARLAGLCREVFGETAFRYTKPPTRLSEHLTGYDPSSAPEFLWPERLKKVQAEILRQAQSRSTKDPQNE